MIKQIDTTQKTTSVTLLYEEIGDIVCTSSTSTTITMPSPNDNLWYRISNVGNGIVTIYYNTVITTLKKTEQALLLANSTTGWWMSKGSGAMTKSEIEAILTGEISTHSHALKEHAFINHSDTPLSYTNQAGKILLVKNTEDGLEFGDTSGTSNLVVGNIDGGKPDSTYPETTFSENMLIPSGGNAGQVLSKVDTTNYNVEWVTLASGNLNNRYYEPLCNNGEILFSTDGDILMGEVI